MLSTGETHFCTVKCCLCGADIPGNGARMCNDCLMMHTNIAEGIEPEASITFCKECGKVLTSTKHWVSVERESIEEMGIMLKMIKGLKKNNLVEARFIWTEPHSRRIIIELDLKKEIENGLVVVGKTRVTFKQHSCLCPSCVRDVIEYTWEAVVQVRQHAEHKRTLLWLEQYLLKSNRHSESINIEVVKGGIDFYFAKKNAAQQFVDYLKSIVLCSVNMSKQLHGQDVNNNIAYFQHTYHVEIPSVCRDDLVLLPRSCARGLSIPLVICTKINAYMTFLHPASMTTVTINNIMFNKYPFTSLLTAQNLKEFTVLDVILDDPSCSEKDPLYGHADIEIIRNDDFGVNDDTLIVQSHLGYKLQPGDIVLGYDLRRQSINNDELDKYDENDLPDVILVTKAKDPEKKKKKNHKKRKAFKELKSKNIENENENEKEIEAYEKDREEYIEENEIEGEEELVAELNETGNEEWNEDDAYIDMEDSIPIE